MRNEDSLKKVLKDDIKKQSAKVQNYSKNNSNHT